MTNAIGIYQTGGPEVLCWGESANRSTWHLGSRARRSARTGALSRRPEADRPRLTARLGIGKRPAGGGGRYNAMRYGRPEPAPRRRITLTRDCDCG